MLNYRIFKFTDKPFLWLIIIFIYLAYQNPEIGAKGGLLKPEITVKYIAVSIIFFISGVSLKTRELLSAAYQFRLHAYIQLYSLVFIPLLVQIFVQLLGQWFPKPELLIGFVAVSCMPPPVSSAVLLTKTVGGNEAAAVFNSALGSFLGIIVTPCLLYLFFSASNSIPVWTAMLQLCITVIFPVIVGQFMQQLVGQCFRNKRILSAVGNFMLLLIIYSTFCETLSKKDPVFTLSTIIITTVSVILLQIIFIGISFFIASHMPSHYSPGDVVAITYCSTHKSLTLGFPMLKILYGNEINFILISFPLLVYHPMQILIGSLLISPLQKWMQKTKKLKHRLYSV